MNRTEATLIALSTGGPNYKNDLIKFHTPQNTFRINVYTLTNEIIQQNIQLARNQFENTTCEIDSCI